MDEHKDRSAGGWWSTRDDRREERRRRREERHAARDARHVDRGSLSVERIAAAALTIVDTEGLEALSLRNLAAALGVGATTIYWYVRDKSELLDIIRDLMAGEVRAVVTPGDDWRGRSAAFARGLRATLRRHPNAAPVWGMRPAIGPNALEIIETVLAAFRDAGLSDTDAADACVVLLNFVVGATVWEAREAGDQSREELATRARDYVASLPADRLPNLRRVGNRLLGGDPDARFELGLGSLLDGFGARPRRDPAAASPPR